MEDDDTDFTASPPHSTSSNLASLFGFTKKPLQGNSSLTYTAPKAPKRESSPNKKTEENPKGKIIFSKAVQAYKLENKSYVSLGLIGIVISGYHNSQIYDIILYKRTKEHLSQIRISNSFTITLSPNKYVSFYDNNKQNWSLMFQTTEEIEQFSKKVAICKFYSQPDPPSEILIQDLAPPSEPKADANDSVEVIYSSYSLIHEESSRLKIDIKEKIKLSNHSFPPLTKGLIGCGEKCKRIVIIPHSLSGPWLNELSPNKDLLLEIKLEKIVCESENVVEEPRLPVEGPFESPIDSSETFSTEESSIKARGASIKEALASTKSQKANLISRMARMGQATLPVKQGLSAGTSDSDEETALTSYPKPRVPRSRIQTGNPPLSGSVSQTCQTHESPQQLSVIQNDLAWQQAQLSKLGIAYQQLVPVSASPISSPTTDPNLSVFLSESRIQATELRMGISKISEKLELVWNKIQNMSGGESESKTHQQALLDSGGILAGIQNIITENESLKEKVEEQKVKIEQQNDRIYNLLELNHKYLEQNSTTHDKQTANESKLKSEMETLQRKKLETEAANKEALEKINSLKSELSTLEETNKELRKRIEVLDAEKDSLQKNLEGNNEEKTKEVQNLKEKITKASETMTKLKERLREVLTENENLKSVIRSQEEELETGGREMKDSKTKNDEYEKAVEDLKKRILEKESENKSKIESMASFIAKLEEENKILMGKMEKEKTSKEKEALLTIIFSALKEEFKESKEYSAEIVLTTVENIFNSAVKGPIKNENEPKDSSTEPKVPTIVPAPRVSLQKVEPEVSLQEVKPEPTELIDSTRKETKEHPPKEHENKGNKEENEIDHKKKDEEAISRYKSYDQGWRTTKPPPPPLFDDEDDDEPWFG